ncbi:lipopolysaccharide heptosyltransferase II, partial [candidate division KSB1 bacterium]
DAAVIPHRSLRSAVIPFLSRIPRRIGFTRSAGRKLLTEKIEYNSGIHEILRNHELLAPLGISGEPFAPSLMIPDEDRRIVQRQFADWGLGNDAPVIGIGPGSKWFTKQWGLKRYGELAQNLVQHHDCRVIFFGGQDEKEQGDTLCRIDECRMFNAAGTFTLLQAAAALEKANAAVTNDNGLMHLAVASGIPVVAVFGPTVPEFGFAPWGERHTVLGRDIYCRPCSIHGTKECPEGHFRCMEEITPGMVLETVVSYLEHGRETGD